MSSSISNRFVVLWARPWTSMNRTQNYFKMRWKQIVHNSNRSRHHAQALLSAFDIYIDSILWKAFPFSLFGVTFLFFPIDELCLVLIIVATCFRMCQTEELENGTLCYHFIAKWVAHSSYIYTNITEGVLNLINCAKFLLSLFPLFVTASSIWWRWHRISVARFVQYTKKQQISRTQK